jgi:transcriptional regulator with XRE-family HTH domain|tara:strand:- start:358 stop:570 length:213 start_codon:yes stop_codon:yes gene_type:complete
MANDIKTRFGKNVRKYRKILGVSQEELAFISGLHRTYISSVENGRRNVSLEAIEKLTDALKIDINKLFDE